MNVRRVFSKLRDRFLMNDDRCMHLALLKSYLDADRKLVELYADPDAWVRKAVLNVAASGKFSGDRIIAGYAKEIRHGKP